MEKRRKTVNIGNDNSWVPPRPKSMFPGMKKQYLKSSEIQIQAKEMFYVEMPSLSTTPKTKDSKTIFG